MKVKNCMLHFPGERVAASFFGRPARKGYFLPEGLNPDTLEGGSAVGAHPFLEFIFQNGKSGAFDQQLPAPPAVCIVALAHDIAEVNVAQACSEAISYAMFRTDMEVLGRSVIWN